MAHQGYVDFLKQGVETWNQWRRENRHVKINLTGVNLSDANLAGVDLSGVNLSGANFNCADLSEANLTRAILTGANLSRAMFIEANLSGADLSGADLLRSHLGEVNLSGAILTGANFNGADLTGANLRRADLSRTILSQAYLMNANLSGATLYKAELVGANFYKADFNTANLVEANLIEANLTGADFTHANLNRADLSGANLSRAKLRGANLQKAILIETILEQADLTDAHIHGISAWNLSLEGAIQSNLVITNTSGGEPIVTIDNLEVAQFIYLLLNNPKIRDVIDTIARKVVLILGRFTAERKIILDTLREHLRLHDYVPVVFDFEKPTCKDLTETVSTLAHLSKFIILDLTDPSSAPHEAATIIPQCILPIQPLIIQNGDRSEYSMFRDLQQRYHWVLPTYRYQNTEELLRSLQECVIAPAERKVKELAHYKRMV